MTLSSFAARAEVRAALLSVVFFLSSCSGGGGGDNAVQAYQVTSTSFAVAAGTPLAFSGAWIAFLADEASSGGADLNGDGEVIDQVAVVANVTARTEKNLGVAAIALAWIENQLFLVVDEVFDNQDWGGDVNTSDLVLLRWNGSLDEPVFVDTLDRGSVPSMLAGDETLFYISGTPGAGPLETSLFAIDAGHPGAPRPVLSQDAVGALTPRLLGFDEGLVFLTLDESVDGRNLNGDADSTDNFVLALLDGDGVAEATGYTKTLRNTGLAIEGSASPYRANWEAEGEWLVGFLVDEAAQGDTNLNLFDGNTLPATWKVTGCVDDADTLDQVLHVIDFAAWDTNPGASPPLNTGIVGTDRVLIVGDVVATISEEADDAGCSLNSDTDSDDRVLRWFRNDGSTGPEVRPSHLLALDTSLSGPAQAVAELDGVLVVQCDEEADSRNHDGASGERSLLGWIDPRAPSPTWLFNHGTSTDSYATATWMGELPGRGNLGVAYAESSNGADLNDDGDQEDSVASFATLSGTPPRLVFPGFPVAIVADDAGISMTGGMGYFRGSEVADERDLNGNGNQTDILLLRLDMTTGNSFLMSALNTLSRDAVESAATGGMGGGLGAAFLFDESIIGVDQSGDQDANDLVIRHFSFQ